MLKDFIMASINGLHEKVELRSKVAKKLYLEKKYDEALQEYSAIIEMSPPNVSKYYVNRAACYMMLGKHRSGLEDGKKSIQLNDKSFPAYVRVIKCCLVLGEITQAETTLTMLLELDPDNKKITTEKKSIETVKRFLKDADAAYNAKDYRKVVYCMDRCCDVSTSGTRFKLLKAECLAFLGRYKEGQDIANDILHIDNQNVDAIYVRGMCLYFQDDMDKALAHLQHVLRLAPDHSKALQIYKNAKSLKKLKEDGNACYKKGRYIEALTLYDQALKIDPQNTATNAKFYLNKAIVYARLGCPTECVNECTKALELDENYLKALLRRATSYMLLENYEEAVRDLEKACKLDKSRDNKRLLMEAKLAYKKSKRKDYYKILGIDKNASADDIKKAYRKQAKVHHPDRHTNATEGEKKEQEQMFKEVGEAYGILSDPKKRSRYDNGQDIIDVDVGFQDFDPMFQAFFARNDNGFQYYTGGSSFQFG